MKKIYINRIIYFTLLIITFVLIFMFSSQNSTISGGLSEGITSKLLSLFNINYGNNSQLTLICEAIIRKLAHLFIYLTAGIWAMCLYNTFNINEKNKILYSITTVCFYACTDEFHQGFTPGRNPSVLDVILDTIGASIGTLIILQATYAKKESNKNKK